MSRINEPQIPSRGPVTIPVTGPFLFPADGFLKIPLAFYDSER